MRQDDTRRQLDDFFQSIEKRALKIAEFAVSNPDDAMDILQNSMIKLVRHYAAKNPDEWTLLFYRILHNEIKDWKRKAWVRGWFGRQDSDIDTLVEKSIYAKPEQPLQQADISDKIHTAIGRLPHRQQQVFLLRCWEGLDIQQTAKVMGCSASSVKTHYSRALHFLQNCLKEEDL